MNKYPVYYVAIWVWDEGVEEYVDTTFVEPTRNHDYVLEVYNSIEITADIAEAIMYKDDGYDVTILHKKDEWGEDWDL